MRKFNFYWQVWSDHLQTCEQNMLLVYLRLQLLLPAIVHHNETTQYYYININYAM